jgi:tellurite resistance protein TehA-like permease
MSTDNSVGKTAEEGQKVEKIMELPGPIDREPPVPLAAFSSNWFVIVMGWGGMTDVAAKLWGIHGNMAPWIEAGVWINSGIFAILLALWVVRWFLSPRVMWREMTQPALSHFFALIPIAMTLMGLNWSLMSGEFGPTVLDPVMNVLWLLAVGLGLLFSIIITDALMRQSHSNPAHVSFIWLLGSVATALFPLLGNVIVVEELHQALGWARFVNIADIAFFGMGLFLFIFFTAYLLGRYFTAPAPPAQATPTSWLLLGAAAVLSLGVLGISNTSVHLGLMAPSSFAFLLGLALWGLAGWSFLLALTMTLRVWFTGQLHFTLSWWAFVFPLSAYVLDTRELAIAGHTLWFNGYSDGFSVLVLVFFLIVLVQTLIELLSGRLFRAP